MSTIPVRAKTPADQAWIGEILDAHWGGGNIVVHGRVFNARTLPALIAGERAGLATYAIEPDRDSAELLTLNAFVRGRGIGTCLLQELVSRLAADSVPRLRLTTTNDNLDALRFYQRHGFRLAALRPGAVDNARKIKPHIPAMGEHGIPPRDEPDLVLAIPL